MAACRLGSIAAAGVLASAVLWAYVDTTEGAEEPRTWTDVAGRKVEATFVRVFNGEVILDNDGHMLKVPLARFSAADQQYVRNATGAKARPAAASGKTDEAKKSATAAPPVTEKSDAPSAETGEPSENRASGVTAKVAAAELRRMREWKDTGGNSVRARFERFFGRQVVLMQGSRPRMVDFARLSVADQDYLRQRFEAQGRGAEVPPAAPAQPNNDAVADNAPAGAIANRPNGGLATALVRDSGPRPAAANDAQTSDIADRMREHQDRIRATQDQLRSQIEQMRDDMKVARVRTPRPTFPRPADNPSSSASQATVASASPFATPSHTSAQPTETTANDPFQTSARANSPGSPRARPPSVRDRMPPVTELVAADPFASAPTIEPRYESVVVCGACNKPQKPGFEAGQRCQHCGRTIDEIADESGKVVDRSARATGRNIKFWVWAVIAVIGMVGGLIAKLKGR